MATLAIQSIDKDGLNPTYAAAAVGGDKVNPGPGVYIEVVNGAGAPINVTLVTPGTVEGDAIADRVVAVTNAQRRKIRVGDEYANPSDSGLAAITYSDVTTITVGAFKVS